MYSLMRIDSNHPHGHGRFESVGALTVGGILVATGIGIGHHSLEHLMHPATVGSIAIWAAVGAIVLKEVVYQITAYIARKQHSQLLLANAWHHRSDAISSLIALVGVVGTQMGFPYFDPLAGLCVAGLIIKIGAESCWQSLKV
jgi:cation diffusion facilitator family transporter